MFGRPSEPLCRLSCDGVAEWLRRERRTGASRAPLARAAHPPLPGPPRAANRTSATRDRHFSPSNKGPDISLAHSAAEPTSRCPRTASPLLSPSELRRGAQGASFGEGPFLASAARVEPLEDAPLRLLVLNLHRWERQHLAAYVCVGVGEKLCELVARSY